MYGLYISTHIVVPLYQATFSRSLYPPSPAHTSTMILGLSLSMYAIAWSLKYPYDLAIGSVKDKFLWAHPNAQP